MDPEEGGFWHRFRWHVLIVCIVLVTVFALAVFTDLFQKSETVRQLVWLLGALVFLAALLTTLARVSKIADTLGDNSSKFEEATKALQKISTGLAQINHTTRISDAAKAIAFREADRQSLREAVFEKLQHRDFESAQQIIDEIANRSEYADLAKELKDQAENYRNATDQERIDHAIAYIRMLLESHQWVTASARIEELIKTYPDCEEAKSLRQEFLRKKDQRKKTLLAAWDDAVNRQDIDRSLDILKELDLYLTPNEGLALQEAARDVFKTKLHNLGVQFSIAVSEKQWDQAVQTGEQIIREFPNSKMAEEIREKMDVLKENVQMQGH